MLIHWGQMHRIHSFTDTPNSSLAAQQNLSEYSQQLHPDAQQSQQITYVLQLKSVWWCLCLMDEGVRMVGKRRFYYRINPVNMGWVRFGILMHFCLTDIAKSRVAWRGVDWCMTTCWPPVGVQVQGNQRELVCSVTLERPLGSEHELIRAPVVGSEPRTNLCSFFPFPCYWY